MLNKQFLIAFDIFAELDPSLTPGSWTMTLFVLWFFSIKYWFMSTRFSKFPLFIFMFLINIQGLFPYTLGITSHLVFVFPIAWTFWSMMIFASKKNYLLASLIPNGAPLGLTPFLGLVETISHLIRPLTLSFRLIANMSTGHIILGMMSIYLITTMPSLYIGKVFYMLFEIGISVIQAYIFSLLLSLYLKDYS